MLFFGILLSLAAITAMSTAILYLIETLLQKVWEIEEFTGLFWKVLAIIRKILICIAGFSACLALITGLIYIIKLLFSAGVWTV